MKNDEALIQAECVKWFTNNFCLKHHNPRGLIFSVPNELGKTNALQTMLAKATGLLSGVSDLVVIHPKTSELVFVELKTSTGVQSDAQIEFEKRVTELGYKYKLIRSVDEFKLWVNLQ